MKILISDDDNTTRLLMATIIKEKLGYEIIETTDGLKAWNALDSGMAPDLCILDMWMPGMSGVALLSKLRSDPRFKAQKVLVCSAENGRNPIIKAASLGVSGYLIKPFVAHQFLDLVRKACEDGHSSAMSGALEPIETVIERLGIGKKTYLDLLRVFVKDVAAVIAALRSSTADENKQNLETRLGGLRGAGRCLGADNLVAAVAQLEKIDANADASLVRQCLAYLEMENNRLTEATESIAASIAPQEKDSKPADPASTEAKPAAEATQVAEPNAVPA